MPRDLPGGITHEPSEPNPPRKVPIDVRLPPPLQRPVGLIVALAVGGVLLLGAAMLLLVGGAFLTSRAQQAAAQAELAAELQARQAEMDALAFLPGGDPGPPEMPDELRRPFGNFPGAAQERIEQAQKVLLLQGTERFGAPDEQTRRALEAIDDLPRLERMSLRLLGAKNWQELLETR
jgi:hypothetical protein